MIKIPMRLYLIHVSSVVTYAMLNLFQFQVIAVLAIKSAFKIIVPR